MSKLTDDGKAQMKVLIESQKVYAACLMKQDTNLNVLNRAHKAVQLAEEAMEDWFERVAGIDHGE